MWLKARCPLSLVPFSFITNDLALSMKSTDDGLLSGEDKVNILLFADNVVPLLKTQTFSKFY